MRNTCIPFNCKNWLALGVAVFASKTSEEAIKILLGDIDIRKLKPRPKKLPEDTIVEMRLKGMSYAEIARHFKVDRSRVWYVLKKKGMIGVDVSNQSKEN